MIDASHAVQDTDATASVAEPAEAAEAAEPEPAVASSDAAWRPRPTAAEPAARLDEVESSPPSSWPT